MSKCSIGLLVDAAHLAYRIEGENSTLRSDEDPRNGNTSTTELTDSIAKAGYLITDKTNPDVKNSTGLTAVRLEPIDEESPIVISYRGTASLNDMLSNTNLGITGTVGNNLRKEAFSFYEETKKKFPHRDIIITGHSLGGHLAQYVGAKAYATEPDTRKSMNLHVRTFNTAPINTIYGEKLMLNCPHVFSQFCNYRLDSDLVSDLFIHDYYGNTFSFQTEKGISKSHPMGEVREVIPEAVKNLEIGGIGRAHRDLNTLKEGVLGIKEAYAVHIKGQWFSKYRMGVKNKELIDKALDSVTECLNKNPPDFIGANKHLQVARFKTSGPTSSHCLNLVIKAVYIVQKEYKVSSDFQIELETPGRALKF
ncbi:lipase family protein [Legionella brunensis]|uniref:Lipase (Class 3) n=1 Tax=Legionella brunensis TaxID=29422 RepID=A0A0W0SPD8_9GAMM|nr:Mbeg1-like protein [Legionella brunensis]KTC85166.1 Lipase (class 3) [Legionella brunensis]